MGENNAEQAPMKKFKGSKSYNFQEKAGKLKPSSSTMFHTRIKQTNSPSKKSEVKFEKILQYKPIELMNKLEDFSDVWNDCPIVENPKNDAKTWKTSDGFEIVSSDYQSKTNKIEKKHNHLKDKSDRENSIKSDDKSNIKTKVQTCSADSFITEPAKQGKIENYESKLADLKRKKAVQEHRKVHVDQKNIIKQALSSLDGTTKTNKKIVFTDENDTQESENYKAKYIKTSVQNVNSASKLKLFNDDDDSETDTNIKLNHQFEGKKGQKLLELQSKFASDSRFTLDTRFYESGSEESDTEKPENEQHTDEKQKQLAILESIIKQPIRPLSDIKKKSNKTSDTLLLRFDPTREEHSKYVVKPQEPQDNEEEIDTKPKKKKTKKDVDKDVNKLEENKPQVSSEKFYAVKDDLKEVLQKEKGKEQFSLLKLFGTKDTEENTQQEETQSIKRLKRGTKNPFKYDSSESEPEEDDKNTEKIVESKQSKKPIASWKTTFFFSENDSRFQEAFEFLKSPDETEGEQEYAEKRKILKYFIRNKYKNNNRKKGSFKKKLGGLKRKSFDKKRATKS